MLDPAWDKGLEALAVYSWDEARQLLSSALNRDAEPRAEHLEALASASWWLNDVDTAILAREKAFVAFTEAGDSAGAARIALELASDYRLRSRPSVSRAWKSRAEEIAAESPDQVVAGHIERARAFSALSSSGDSEAAMAHTERAIAIARDVGDINLEMLASHDKGKLLVGAGRVDEGIREMERVMISAGTGQLDAVTTGKIYCTMISTCLDVSDFGTAAEWNEEAERWCSGVANVGGYPGICRINRSEVNRRRGQLDAAAAGAEQAEVELAHFIPLAAAAITEIGNVHLQRGDLEQAEVEFLKAHAMGVDPMPGMALLRHAQGRTESAAALIVGALESQQLPLDRLKLLPAAVEILVANGDSTSASVFAAEMREMLACYSAPAVRGSCEYADGLIAADEGRNSEAVIHFRAALAAWTESGIPYDANKSRAALGHSLVAAGRPDIGELEIQAAAAGFTKLGVRQGDQADSVPAEPEAGSTVETEVEDEDVLVTLGEFQDLVVSRFAIVGRYTRFAPEVRNTLADARQRIVAGLVGSGSTRENHLLWAAPGSGKTFFAEEIARSLDGVEFIELNLARLDEAEMRQGLDDALAVEGPTLVLLDEVDARRDADWPYGMFLPYLDANAKRAHPIVFVMAGSGGADFLEFRASISGRPKGSDLLSRTPESNFVEIAGLGVGDRMLLAVTHFLNAAHAIDRSVVAVERSALYYIAVTDYLRNARQLAEFAARTVDRMAPGEDRVKFDHLFAPGDPENKAFWERVRTEAPQIAGDFLTTQR